MLVLHEIIERLKDVLSAQTKGQKVYDKDVADALELSQVNFATMKKRGKIPYNKVLDFCAMKKISINWLLYNQNPRSLVDTTDQYWIRYFPEISVGAGEAAHHEQSYEQLEIPPYFVNMLGGEKSLQKIDAINVVGDSMEPTLHSDDIIFVDTSTTSIIKEGIYAFTNSNGLYVKRLQKRVDGHLDVISDNKEYPVQTIQSGEISILGKVVGSFGSIY